MTAPLVSIVIPVYNSENYLKACIESVCQQTYSKIEIIPVNDCSTDQSLAILEGFAAVEDRVHLVDLAENVGILAARAAGASRARGDYLAFLDSDDLMDASMIETLVENAIQSKSDITICGARIIDANGKLNGSKASFSRKTLNGSECFQAFCRQELGTAVMWNKLYKLETMKDCLLANFGWKPDAAEDSLVNLGCFAHASQVSTIPETLYSYRIHAANTTSSANKALGFTRILRAYASAIQYYSRFSEESLALIDEYYRSSLRHPVYHVSKPEELKPESAMLREAVCILGECRPNSLYELANLGLTYPTAAENILHPGKSSLKLAKRSARKTCAQLVRAIGRTFK